MSRNEKEKAEAAAAAAMKGQQQQQAGQGGGVKRESAMRIVANDRVQLNEGM